LFRNKAKHRLIVIGDSLSQGFSNGCIYRTDLNYPSMLIHSLDDDIAFEQPHFTSQGGLPLNLEVLVRGLCDIYGKTIKPTDYPSALKYLYSTSRRIKRFWDGEYIPLNEERTIPYHNQSIWGQTIADSWLMSEKISRQYIETHPPRFNLMNIMHGNAMYTTARRVLNPSFTKEYELNSMIDNARYFAENGGIENLIVYLGSNNIVGAVTELDIRYSEDNFLEIPSFQKPYTVARPAHFEHLYRKLAEKVSSLGAQNIITGTIPYVTIPPVSRGINVNRSQKSRGYFDYYTRFWIWDDSFDPDIHPNLTKDEAIELDIIVDEYNRIIRKIADEYGWIVVPLNKMIEGLGNRRKGDDYYIPFPEGLIEALKRYKNTEYLVLGENHSKLTSDYFRLDDETGQLYKGGIFSLDGLHPTTIGYGLIAQEFYDTMKANGIHFKRPIDWDFIVSNDSLITYPPYLLIELRKILRFLSLGPREQWSRLSSNLFLQVMNLFNPGEGRAEKHKKDNIFEAPANSEEIGTAKD
jgi:hypothetical protein